MVAWGAGSPGPGGVPGGRRARRGLEAEGLASPCLESSESDRGLRLSVRDPAGASGFKWQKEAERLRSAALASAPVGLRGALALGCLGAKGTSQELGRGDPGGSPPPTCLPGREVLAPGGLRAEVARSGPGAPLPAQIRVLTGE